MRPLRRLTRALGAVSRRRRIAYGAVLMAVGLLLAVAIPSPYVGLARVILTELDPLDLTPYHSVLVLAPHADDETLGAGGLILAAERAGLDVQVVVVTNGDGYLMATIRDTEHLIPRQADFRRIGAQRQDETLAATQILGLDASRTTFLSYPDRGLLEMWLTRWESDRPYRSPYSGATQSPYPRTYNPTSTYSGADLLADLTAILEAHRPDLLILPTPLDEHPDHRAASAFARLAVARLQRIHEDYRPTVLGYLVHAEGFPFPRLKGANPQARLLPPPAMAAVTTGWLQVPLDVADAARKAQAIGAYRTQAATLKPFLEAFVRGNELFVPLPADQPIPVLGAGEPFRPDTWLGTDGMPLEPVALDPLADQTLRRRVPSADLQAVYAARQGAESVVVCSQLRGRRLETLSYVLRVVAVGQQGVVHYSAWSGYNQADPQAAKAAADMVCEQIPLPQLGDPWLVALASEARIPGGTVVDSTGWTLLELR